MQLKIIFITTLAQLISTFHLPAYAQQSNLKRTETPKNSSVLPKDETDQRIFQTILDRNSEDFSSLEKLYFREEHASYKINDSINTEKEEYISQKKKNSELINKTFDKYGQVYLDSIKRNKLRPIYIDSLKLLFEDNFRYDKKMLELDNQVLDYQKEILATRSQIDKLQNKLQNRIDTINNLISKSKNVSLYKLYYNKITYRILVVPTQDANIKIHANTSKRLQPLKATWDQSKVKPFAIFNAGMYEQNGSAKGLLIVDKKIFQKIDESKKPAEGNFYMQPNGIFYIDSSQRVFIKKTEDFKKIFTTTISGKYVYATQSGPMLLSGGKSNPNFNINSSNRNIRNGVGVVSNSDNKIAVFIISDVPCTFYEFASIFRLLRCNDALYLDGAISKMYTELNGKKTGNLVEGGLGPVISVSPKR